MSDHVLGDGDGQVVFTVVDEEAQADKVGQNGGGACLSPDRRRLVSLSGLWLDYGEAAMRVIVSVINCDWHWSSKGGMEGPGSSYGTM